MRMATLYTHAVVGLGLGAVLARQRMPWLYWCLAALLPVLPDLDTLSHAPYGSMAGHRGATHSLIFALWLAFLVASLTFRYFRTNLWVLTCVFFVVIVSQRCVCLLQLRVF